MSAGAGAGTRLMVFGDDGSPGADVAWLWVCTHQWEGWRAEVVTAAPATLPPEPSGSSPEPKEWDSPHARLRVSQSALASIRHLREEADPRVVLGRRSDADLLVVGPRGLGHVKALLVGSTTEWLLHHPPAPLAIVRSAAPVRRVVACVDGSVHAQAAVDAFARLPWAGGTEVVVFSVYDGWSDIESGQAGALASLAREGVTATSMDVRGRGAHTILEQLDELRPQLVLLGTRGLTGWRRMTLGSTAGAVARATTCSVLLACVTHPEPDPAPA